MTALPDNTNVQNNCYNANLLLQF